MNEPTDEQYGSLWEQMAHAISPQVPQVSSQNFKLRLIGTVTSPVNKKQQEASTRKEIAKRRQLYDESESDSSSSSEVHYNITSSNESPVVNTRAKSKAQEAAEATTSPPQYDEGSDEYKSDGDNPPADNVEKGNNDVEELGDDDINAEESGDKDSAAEESNEQVEDSEPSTTPEARSKIWFL
ncbi:hypothetical protein HAX54_009598 [Datura stramonium]|uniref:Uncharacterized protein n=1 Tax=Datura stramonium TaxID=4076 RepID=A0ABS8TGP6_DATST|nr:hypothetical protein [Datura stramonium]